MDDGIGTVERAFQLAQSGEFYSIEDIRRRLKYEQRSNVDDHLSGPTIKRQLHQEIELAQEAEG